MNKNNDNPSAVVPQRSCVRLASIGPYFSSMRNTSPPNTPKSPAGEFLFYDKVNLESTSFVWKVFADYSDDSRRICRIRCRDVITDQIVFSIGNLECSIFAAVYFAVVRALFIISAEKAKGIVYTNNESVIKVVTGHYPLDADLDSVRNSEAQELKAASLKFLSGRDVQKGVVRQWKTKVWGDIRNSSLTNNKTLKQNNMQVTIEGKITNALAAQTGVSQSSGKPWKSQTFIIDTADRYQPNIAVRVFGEDKIATMPPVGSQVKLLCDLSSREYKGNWYTQLDLYKVDEHVAAQPQPVPVPQPQAVQQPAPQQTSAHDELPF